MDAEAFCVLNDVDEAGMAITIGALLVMRGS